jgi:hypothetical protein
MREDYNMPWTFKSCAYKLEGKKHINILKQEEIQAIPAHSSCAHMFWVSEYFSENTLHQLQGQVGDAFVNNIVWMVVMRPSSSLVP